jgi:aliphatic sulfonates family ABC transporter substrate-binding protein
LDRPCSRPLSAGSVDYGYTGDAPPIFAQAARANLLYAAAIPTRGFGQAIIVPEASPIQAINGFQGKKVAVAKGSSAHNLLVAALESAKLAWSAITPVYLAPADAAAAFAGGAVDAWSIWDPFLAIAELKQKTRALPVNVSASAQNSFFLVNSGFAAKHPEVVATINAAVASATKWVDGHRDEVADMLAEASGVNIVAEKRSVARAEFTFGPLSDEVLSQQQAIADRFLRLGLIGRVARLDRRYDHALASRGIRRGMAPHALGRASAKPGCQRAARSGGPRHRRRDWIIAWTRACLQLTRERIGIGGRTFCVSATRGNPESASI